jgi:hypothetical protein
MDSMVKTYNRVLTVTKINQTKDNDCAVDAAFRAAQQQVAIPGWLW